MDTKMDLRPPVRRSWLRLRLGKAYYAGKRYLLWCSPKYRWAKTRKEERLPCVQFSHATPLMRHLRGEEMVWQENKVTNLKLAVSRLDGLILKPGETFSYWRLIGRPTARKGYKEGMVLFLGRIGGDIGGGLCQLSNLIFWMTLHTPLTVTERGDLRLSPSGPDDPQRHGPALSAVPPGGGDPSGGGVALGGAAVPALPHCGEGCADRSGTVGRLYPP